MLRRRSHQEETTLFGFGQPRHHNFIRDSSPHIDRESRSSREEYFPGSSSLLAECETMTNLKFHGLLELSCAVLGFEVGEIWQVKNYKNVEKRTLQFRQIHSTHVSDDQRSHLVCPDTEGPADLSKHKVSPVLCHNACDTGQIVLVNARACEGLVLNTNSPLLSLHTAIAVPLSPSGFGDDQIFVMVLLSAMSRQVSFQMIDFICALADLINRHDGSECTKSESFQLKKSTSSAEFQKYYVESAHHGDNDSSGSETTKKLPYVFFGDEPDAVIRIQRMSNRLNALDGVLAHSEMSEGYKHFLSGLVQLEGLDIAEMWLPDSQGMGLKMVSSYHVEDTLKTWLDCSNLLILNPDIDLPGKIIARSESLVDYQYNAHQPVDVNYPRALFATVHGLQVAFGIPVPGNIQSLGALVFYSRKKYSVIDKLLRVISSGASLLASGETHQPPKSNSHDKNAITLDGKYESKDSKELVDAAFMSALDTVFEDVSDWDLLCQDVTTSHSSDQQLQQVTQTSNSTAEDDHQFKHLTSRVYSETLNTTQQTSEMSKRSRPLDAADTSSGIIQNQHQHQHQSYSVNYNSQHSQQDDHFPPFQQYQHMPSVPVPVGAANAGQCVNCHKISSIVNGYCKGCSNALAAYFMRNNETFSGPDIRDVGQEVNFQRRHQFPSSQNSSPLPTPFPVARTVESVWDQQQGSRNHFSRHSSTHSPHFELRKSIAEGRMDDMEDVSRHSYHSDLDVSQHSTMSRHSDHGVDLNNFRSTLDLSRSRYRDPLDVQHHPVNVNRYNFFHQKDVYSQHGDHMNVSKHSNISDADADDDNDLDKTHHPVNVDKYKHHSNHNGLSKRSDAGAGSGKHRICRFEGCSDVAIYRSPYCASHAGNRKCMHEGCTKCAQGSTAFCIAHGGGRRCTYPGCNKGARDKFFCAAHGGGKRCTMIGCTKAAVGRSTFCTSHGGGKRCMEPGCTKSSQSSTQYCVRHGGGRKCALVGCNKVARGRTNFCATHKKQDTVNKGHDDGTNSQKVKNIATTEETVSKGLSQLSSIDEKCNGDSTGGVLIANASLSSQQESSVGSSSMII